MKIAQVVCTFPPYRGGIGNCAYHFARLAASRGHEVTVFTPAYGRDRGLAETREKFEVCRLYPLLSHGNGAFLPQLAYRLRGFDLVHLHYPFFGGTEALWLAKLFGDKSKLVIHYHMDVLGLPWYAEFLRLPERLVRAPLFGRADRITCASIDYIGTSQAAGLYRKYPEKFAEIPFGVDLDRFRPEKAPDRGNGSIPDIANILFVGGLDQAHFFKGVGVLLEAMAKIKHSEAFPWRLVIVGEGALKARYREQAARLGINEQTAFAGKVPGEELARHYRQADVLVLPSVNRNEAFGLVLLEAMASGTAVVASRLPGVRTVFTDGKQGFYTEPGNPDDLAARLIRLLKNDEERLAMAAAGRKLAEEKYGWERVGERLEELYISVVVKTGNRGKPKI